MIHRSFARVAILGLCSCLARHACAEISVLIITPNDDALDYSIYESRLRSELLAAGFSVSAERVQGIPDYSLLARSAERSASQAAIAVAVSDGELCGLLWIGEQSNPSGLMRPVRCCPLDDAAPLVFAVRASDALSAALLELRYPKGDPPAPVASRRKPEPARALPGQPQPQPPAPEILAEPKPARERDRAGGTARPQWHAQASGVVAAWLRDFPLAYGIKLELARDLDSSWSAGIQGYALAPSTVTRSPGEARITQFLSGIGVRYQTELGQRLRILDGLGVGLYVIDVSADAVTPLRSQHVFSSSGYFSFEHQVHFEIVRFVSVVAGLGVSAPWTRYSIDMLSTTVARAAAPLLLANLGLQLNLP